MHSGLEIGTTIIFLHKLINSNRGGSITIFLGGVLQNAVLSEIFS